MLPKKQARLRMKATKALGKALARTDAAFRHVLYNRKASALDRITSAEYALAEAEIAIDAWIASEAQPRRKR